MKDLNFFKTVLFDSFIEWLQHHKSVIGDKWYGQLTKQTKDARTKCVNGLLILSDAMWIFNMISQFGVMAGLGPAKVMLQVIPEQFDEKLTNRVLLNCSSCLCLQYLPPEIMKQPFEGNT